MEAERYVALGVPGPGHPGLPSVWVDTCCGWSCVFSGGLLGKAIAQGSPVVLVFAEMPGSMVDRPERGLVGVARVRPAADESVSSLTMPAAPSSTGRPTARRPSRVAWRWTSVSPSTVALTVQVTLPEC